MEGIRVLEEGVAAFAAAEAHAMDQLRRPRRSNELISPTDGGLFKNYLLD